MDREFRQSQRMAAIGENPVFWVKKRRCSVNKPRTDNQKFGSYIRSNPDGVTEYEWFHDGEWHGCPIFAVSYKGDWHHLYMIVDKKTVTLQVAYARFLMSQLPDFYDFNECCECDGYTVIICEEQERRCYKCQSQSGELELYLTEQLIEFYEFFRENGFCELSAGLMAQWKDLVRYPSYSHR